MIFIYFIIFKETFHWKKVQTSGQAPTSRRAHTAVLAGTKLYIFGGVNNNFALNDTYVLDTG